MRGSGKFCQKVSNTYNVFFFIFLFIFIFHTIFFIYFYLMGWIEDRNATKSGPSSARQENAIEMAFRLRADNGPPLNAGLAAL